MDDELFEKKLDSSLKKRTRTKTDIEKEAKSEAITFSLEHEIGCGWERA